MAMKHVFVESNWVFQYVEPEFKRKPAAGRLVERAIAGELTLHVPGVCLREGAESVRRKCQYRHELAEFRGFAARKGNLSNDESKIIERFLDGFHKHIKQDIKSIDERLDLLSKLPNVSIFALSEAMLTRALELRRAVVEVNQMKPFDEAILAAVLVQAEIEHRRGASELFFCTLDSDLWPYTKNREPRRGLESQYATAGITVLQGFDVP
jgi:hypothetical protein